MLPSRFKTRAPMSKQGTLTPEHLRRRYIRRALIRIDRRAPSRRRIVTCTSAAPQRLHAFSIRM